LRNGFLKLSHLALGRCPPFVTVQVNLQLLPRRHKDIKKNGQKIGSKVSISPKIFVPWCLGGEECTAPERLISSFSGRD
jgi:hypothetical protein